MDEIDKEIQAAIELKFRKSQEDLQELQKKNDATEKELKEATSKMIAMGDALEAIEEKMKAEKIETILGQFKEFLLKEENIDELKNIVKTKQGSVEFIAKAVGDISNASGTTVDTPPVNASTTLGNVGLVNNNQLLNFCTVTSSNSDVYKYTEMLPKEGSYNFVAEAGTKPQIDFKWENRYQTPKKIAAYEVLSTEVIQDVARMMTTARAYLMESHDLFKVDAIYFADGTGEKPTGATVYGRTFVAGDMALAVPTPNFMDTVNACITDIYSTHTYANQPAYMANVAFISIIDFYIEFQSAKDANGLPLYPQASLFNQVTIGGVTIKPWRDIPAGKIFVADMKKYNVINYIPFSITLGWINDQFITNQFTMVGESRFYAFVKNLDQQAFIYDDIATIKAAITKP